MWLEKLKYNVLYVRLIAVLRRQELSSEVMFFLPSLNIYMNLMNVNGGYREVLRNTSTVTFPSSL